MLWPTPILILLAATLAVLGYSITNGSGSADERVGGAIFYVGSAICFVLAVLWWIGAVTWKAFT